MEDLNIPDEIEAALMRVIAREKMESLILLNHIKEIKNQMIELESKNIFAVKEADAVHDGKETFDAGLAAHKSHISLEILELIGTKLNHTLVRDTLQKAAFNVQMQDAVHESLQGLDVEGGVENSPEMRKLLEHHNSNLYTSKTLVDTIEEKEQLDRDILQSRMKCLTILKDVKEEWLQFESKGNTSVGEEDAELAQCKHKIETREEKMRIIIHMLQGLISTSGIIWGTDDYFIQVMLFCDILLNEESKSDVEKLQKSIEKLREKKEEKSTKKNAKESKAIHYVTSTPTTKSMRL